MISPRLAVRSISIALLLAACFTGTGRAQSDNNSFADAIALSGATVSVVATNALEDDLATGEFNPAEIGGSSVWFKWTAPADGWYTIHTVGATPAQSLDTLLVLCTGGTSEATTNVLGFNDESFRYPDDYPIAIYPDEFGPSRLVFLAVAGTEYHIAVHGWGGDAGTFRLSIEPEATPEALVSSVSLSPNPANVSSGPVSVAASITVESASPIAFGAAGLWNPVSLLVDSPVPITPALLTSSSPPSRTYGIPLTAPGSAPPGLRPVVVEVPDPDGFEGETLPWSTIGRDALEDYFLIPASPGLTIENTGAVDVSPPVLTGLSGLPAGIDLATNPGPFPITFTATDNLSGVSSIIIQLVQSVENVQSIVFADGSYRTIGSALSGTYEADFGPLLEMPTGVYDLVIEMVDEAGNSRIYGGESGDAMPPGIPASITVSITLPANNNFANRITVGPTLPIATTGHNRYATIQNGESNLNGTATNSVWYQWTPDTSGWVAVQATGLDGFQPITAVFQGTTVGSVVELGRNNGSLFNGGDAMPLVFRATAGTAYQIAVLGGIETTPSGAFELSITSAVAPAVQVTAVSVAPATVDVATGSQSVTVDVTVQSAAGIFPSGSLKATLLPASNSSGNGTLAEVSFSSADFLSGTPTDATYRQTLTIPGYQVPENWHLLVEASADSFNFFRWTPRGANPVQDTFLMDVSGGTLVVANSGSIDFLGPDITALSGFPSSANIADGPVPVTLQVTISDDVAGFADGEIYLTSYADGENVFIKVADILPANLTSGNAVNGDYQVSFDIPDTLAPGSYNLEVFINDAIGKNTAYGPFEQSFPVGSTVVVRVTTTPTGGYTGWAAGQDFGGGPSGPQEDANNDGSSNLLAFAFNLPPAGPSARPMTPGAGDLSGLPAITVVGEGENRRLRVEYLRRRSPASGLTYVVQFGATLESGGPGGWSDTAESLSPEIIDADWERVVVEDTVTGQPGRFGRVVVRSDG